jgi:dienelactone hydrolase
MSDDSRRFAAHVVFYADCTTTYLGDTDVTGKPMLILHGARDNWNALGPCRKYVARLKDASKDIQLIEYPDAHHAFDNPNFRKPIIVKGAPSTRKCLEIENDAHEIINVETQRPFTYKDACVEKDTTVAYSLTASSQAHKVVGDFFKKVFQLQQ